MIKAFLLTLMLLTFTAIQSNAQTDQNKADTSAEAATAATEVEAAVAEGVDEGEPEEVPGARVEKLEVTGSYIRRTDIEGPSPVLVIDREQIEKSGFNSVGAILTRSTASPFGGDGQEVGLKGLGSGRTLVLINGQRAPGSGSSYSGGGTNLNFVPIAAVERIEVLKDGASATYGSDALGGVINIITRKDLSGFSFANKYDMSTNIGTDTNLMSLAYGHQTSKSNVISSLQFRYSQGLRASNLDYLVDLNKSFRRSTNYTDDAHTETVPSIRPGPNCTNVDGGLCVERVSPMQTTDDSFGLDFVTDWTYSLESDMELYSTFIAGFAKAGSDFPNTLNTPGKFPGVKFTAAESPAAWNSLPGYSGGDITVWHRFDDYVRKTKNFDYNAALILGLKGYFGDSDWQWDITANNQINVAEASYENLATFAGAKNVLGSGQYNPFNLTDRDTNGLGIDATTRNWSALSWFEAKTNGSLGNFLGFDWASAFGTSIAHFQFNDSRAAAFVNGDIMGFAGVLGSGERQLYSFFAEVNGIKSNTFEVQLSMRGDFYSDFGQTFNPKIATRYQPYKWLTFRSSFGTGFQAPTLQNVNSNIEGFDFLQDQVRCKDPGIKDCAIDSFSILQQVNPNIKEETSVSFNFGSIVQPTKNFSASLDWWYVKVNDTIGVELNDILFLETLDPNAPANNGVNIIRQGGTATGRIERITYQLQNLGTEEANGVDFELNYRMPTTVGDFRMNNMFSYLGHFFTSFYPELGRQQTLGQFGKPRWRNNLTLGYKRGLVDFQLVARSIADVEKRNRQEKIVSPTQFDFSVAYDPSWAGEFRVGGINIGNIRPRFDDSLGAKVDGDLFIRVETYYLTYRQDF